jgi:hypothetical protein
MTEQSELKEIKKSGRKLPAGNGYLEEAEYRPQRFYSVINDVNTTVEDLLEPGFFGNHASKFKVGGADGFPEITVDWEDGSKSVELKVLGVPGAQTVKVALKHIHDFSDATAELADAEAADTAGEFKVEWKGAGKKHCIVRVKDKAIVKDGFSTKADALAGLAQFSKSIAA